MCMYWGLYFFFFFKSWYNLLIPFYHSMHPHCELVQHTLAHTHTLLTTLFISRFLLLLKKSLIKDLQSAFPVTIHTIMSKKIAIKNLVQKISFIQSMYNFICI